MKTQITGWRKTAEIAESCQQTKITTQRDVEGPLAAKLHSLGGNLYLDVSSATSRQWLFIFKRNGRQRSKGLGSAIGTSGPKITLSEARRRAERCRAILADGLDPITEDRRDSTLFAAYAETIIDRLRPSWRNPTTESNWRRSLLNHAKALAREPVATLDSAKIKTVLDPIRFIKHESAQQLRQRIEHMMREAKADGLRSGDNPASRENLGWGKERGKRKVRHHPAMPYEMLPGFAAGLDAEVDGHVGLKLLILTVTRTSEVAGACRSEFAVDGDNPLWTIPAWRVKNGDDHLVPLTKQMLAVLTPLFADLDGGDRLFPTYTRFTMLHALKAIEGCDGFTVHGFRSTFKDWCGNETAFARDIVEETYGHDPSEGDSERAYRRKAAMKKRRAVLTAWNAYASTVVPMRKAVAA